MDHQLWDRVLPLLPTGFRYVRPILPLGSHRRSMRPGEAFDNFPPGLPGRMVAIASRLPGGLPLAARQLRIGWLRRLPPLHGQMTRRPVPDDLVRRWTEPLLRDRAIRRDLRAYCTGPLDRAALVRDTEAVRGFPGEVLVLWSPANRVMPPAHGRRLAALFPRARYADVPDAYVLSPLDEPAAVAREMGRFLTSTHPRPDQRPADP